MTYKKGDKVFQARIIPSSNIFELNELVIRTVSEDGWYVGIDKKDKHAYMFYEKDINIKIFSKRSDAISKIREEELKE